MKHQIVEISERSKIIITLSFKLCVANIHHNLDGRPPRFVLTKWHCARAAPSDLNLTGPHKVLVWVGPSVLPTEFDFICGGSC